MAINEVDAELLGVYLLSITYGVYLVIFTQCVIAFYRRGFGSVRTYWLPCATLLIFIVATIHLVTSLIRAWEAFHLQPNNISVATKVFRDVASLPALIKNGAFIGQTILTDAIMVYRTYIVWGSSWVPILVPSAALCGDIAMGIWSMWTLAHTGVDGDPIVAEVVLRVKYFYIVTLVLNVICSGLIAYHIWRIDAVRRRVDSEARARTGPSRLGRVVNVIVESAAVYCACLVVLIVTSAKSSDVMFTVLDMMPHLMAIIFSLIIVRVFRGTSFATTRRNDTSGLGTMRFGARTHQHTSNAMAQVQDPELLLKTQDAEAGHRVEVDLVHSDTATHSSSPRPEYKV